MKTIILLLASVLLFNSAISVHSVGSLSNSFILNSREKSIANINDKANPLSAGLYDLHNGSQAYCGLFSNEEMLCITKKVEENYGQDTAITLSSSFSSDMAYLENYYKNKGILVAGPFNGSVGEHAYDHPLISSYCSFQLKPNRTYEVKVIKDKKYIPCEELTIKLKISKTQSKAYEPLPKTLMPDVSKDETWIGQKHHVYSFIFKTDADYKNITIRAYSKCPWNRNARIFIFNKE